LRPVIGTSFFRCVRLDLAANLPSGKRETRYEAAAFAPQRHTAYTRPSTLPALKELFAGGQSKDTASFDYTLYPTTANLLAKIRNNSSWSFLGSVYDTIRKQYSNGRRKGAIVVVSANARGFGEGKGGGGSYNQV